jgi:hypothetical protein
LVAEGGGSESICRFKTGGSVMNRPSAIGVERRQKLPLCEIQRNITYCCKWAWLRGAAGLR